MYFLKFILDITDIGEGKHRKETWTYNQYRSEIADPSWASVMINAYALYEKRPLPSFLLWDSDRLVLLLLLLRIWINIYFSSWFNQVGQFSHSNPYEWTCGHYFPETRFNLKTSKKENHRQNPAQFLISLYTTCSSCSEGVTEILLFLWPAAKQRMKIKGTSACGYKGDHNEKTSSRIFHYEVLDWILCINGGGYGSFCINSGKSIFQLRTWLLITELRITFSM